MEHTSPAIIIGATVFIGLLGIVGIGGVVYSIYRDRKNYRNNSGKTN